MGGGSPPPSREEREGVQWGDEQSHVEGEIGLETLERRCFWSVRSRRGGPEGEI